MVRCCAGLWKVGSCCHSLIRQKAPFMIYDTLQLSCESVQTPEHYIHVDHLGRASFRFIVVKSLRRVKPISQTVLGMHEDICNHAAVI
jgi:hypothetical protein